MNETSWPLRARDTSPKHALPLALFVAALLAVSILAGVVPAGVHPSPGAPLGGAGTSETPRVSHLFGEPNIEGDVVQEFTPGSSSGTSPTINVPSGSAVWVWIVSDDTTASDISSVTDSAGNTYTYEYDAEGASSLIALYIKDAPTASSSDAITLHVGVTTHYWSFMVVVLTSVGDPSLAATSASAQADGDSPFTDTVTATASDQLLFLGLSCGADGGWPTFSGYDGSSVQDSIANDIVEGTMALFYATAGSTGTITVGGEDDTDSCDTDGGQSNVWFAAAAADQLSAPYSPTGVTIYGATSTSAAISWTDHPGTGQVNATVFQFTGSSCSSGQVDHSTGSSSASYTVTGLTAGDTYSFEVEVWNSTTHSAPSACVALLISPSPSATHLDRDQTLTMSSTIPSTGAPPYQWEWLYSVNNGTYTKAIACATPSGSGASGGAEETCNVASNALTTSDAYTFEFRVNDSASSPETMTSAASSYVYVRAALTAPSTPTASSYGIITSAALTVSATLSSTGTWLMGWTWLMSTNYGSYATATHCATNSGIRASGGATETCSIAGGTLTAGDTYNFELKQNDTASLSETATSAASATVSVYSTLGTPGAPSISGATLDVDQTLTVQDTVPSSGVPTYSWTWLVSVNSGSYATATICAANSGSGASEGATETCSVTGGTLTTGDTYNFEFKVSDSDSETATSAASSTVTVHSALTAPTGATISSTVADTDQALTVQGTLSSTGTSTYSWEWLISINSGSYGAATQCAVNSGTGATGGSVKTCSISASTLTAGDTYAFKLQQTDSASSPETTLSSAVTVSEHSPLTAAGTPSVSATSLSAATALTVQSTLASTGAPTYAWLWQYSTNAGAYATATVCGTDSGSGASGGATETCTIAGGTLTAGDTYAFKIQVTDSATTAETTTSSASSTVTVNDDLTAAATPTVSGTVLDADQALTVSDNVPSTGEPTYSWTWLVSVNSAGYATSTVCATNSGTGASANAAETCSVSGGALTSGDTYNFEFKVTDADSEVSTSPSSATVSVYPALTAPGTPSVLAVDGASETSITLSWTWPGGPVDYYVIQYGTVNGTWTGSANTEHNVTSYGISGLTPDTTYYFQVSAVNGGGAGDPSPVVSGTTLAPVAGTGGGFGPGTAVPYVEWALIAAGLVGVAVLVAVLWPQPDGDDSGRARRPRKFRPE